MRSRNGETPEHAHWNADYYNVDPRAGDTVALHEEVLGLGKMDLDRRSISGRMAL
jgi:hypothetical protein